MRHWFGLVVASFAAFSPSLALAQDSIEGELDLVEQFAALEEELEVWVATKTAGSLESAPAVVTVLKGEEIRAAGYRSLADALRSVLGFYVIDDHSLPNVTVRGVAGGQWGESGNLKVMIDGHPVAFRPTAGNWLGPELIPLSAIERVEIVRGPASALYGADAFLGVINVVTRGHEQLEDAVLAVGVNRMQAGLGTDVDLGVTTRISSFDLGLFLRNRAEDRSGLGLPSSSPSPLVPGFSDGRTDAREALLGSTVGLLKVGYSHGSFKATLSGYLSAIDHGAEFSPWAQLGNGLDEDGRLNVNRVNLRSGHVGLRLEQAVGKTLNLSLDTLYFQAGVGPNDRIEVASDVYYVRRDLASRGFDSTLEARWSPLAELTLIAGANVIVDRELLPSTERVLKIEADSQPAGSAIASSRIDQGSRTFLNPAVFAQAVWTPIERWLQVTGGARLDHHSIYGTQLSPRLGLVSNPVGPLHAKLLYGAAFKAPSPVLLYAVPYRSGDVVGNPDLDPQRVQTIEGELIYKPLPWLTASTALSYSLLNQKAEFALAGVHQVARNLAEVGAVSWESQLKAHWGRYVEGQLGFEKQWLARYLGEEGYRAELVGAINEGAPSHILRVALQGRVPQWFAFARLEANWVGEREASAINALLAGGRYQLDPYLMVDATLALQGLRLFPDAGRETTLSLALRNLLGAEAVDPGYAGVDYPLAARSIELSLRQSF